MADKLMIGQLTPEKVYTTLVEKGLTKGDAASFVGEWLIGEFGFAPRTFDYVQPFAVEKPNCAPKFARGFIHQDWVDGEDVVQAGETAGEEGFNKRFHAIEQDLDNLAKDGANLFACLAEMRKEISTLLAEIRNEFNRINKLLGKGPGLTVPPFTAFPLPNPMGTGTLLGTIKFNDKPMTLWNTAQGMLMLPAASVINPSPLEDPRTTSPGKFVKFVAEHDAVRERFPQRVKKEEFIEAFGRELADDGVPVRQLLEVLPANAEYENVDAMAKDLVERQAAALRTTPGIEATVFATMGVDMERQKPAEATLSTFEAIPDNVRTALIRNGIDTIGKLAEAGPAGIGRVLERENVRDVSPGAAAEWATRARTVSLLR